MPNVFANLPLPVDNGPGASVAVSTMGPDKTVVVSGSFEGAAITIEASVDGGTKFAPVATFQTGSTKKEIPCPDAEKWEKEGYVVLYVEKMTLDLAAMKGASSGKFFCESAAPITKRAADYTIH